MGLTNKKNRQFDPDPLVLSNKNEEWYGSLRTRPVWTWSEVRPGTMVYLKYFMFWHAVLVTDVHPDRGMIRGIHYAVASTIFDRRVVSEDEFYVHLRNRELWEVRIPETVRVPAEEAVRRARERIGERRFNMFTRRSRHVVLECILKGNLHED